MGSSGRVALGGRHRSAATILGVAADARRRALPHRRVARRDPAPLGPRRAPGAHATAARDPVRASHVPGDSPPDASANGAVEPPVDVAHDYPDLVSSPAAPPRLRRRWRGRRGGGHCRGHADLALRLGRRRRGRTTGCPSARCCAEVEPDDRPERGRERAHGRGARPVPRELRRRGDRRRPDLRAARDALRAAARARHEGRQGRAAEGRPLVRARDDRDPHPRADPRQAGRRRRGAEPLAEPRHARRHLRRPAGVREPGLGLARQGHLGRRRLDRPRANAAPPDRRHDRLGQVGLHQHDPHVDPAARDARRGAADPDRPEADRAQLLRVDPAPADAGRLEPEGGERRAAERRHRDGAPLRAPLARSRAQPARGEPRVPQARRGGAARTCSS